MAEGVFDNLRQITERPEGEEFERPPTTLKKACDYTDEAVQVAGKTLEKMHLDNRKQIGNLDQRVGNLEMSHVDPSSTAFSELSQIYLTIAKFAQKGNKKGLPVQEYVLRSIKRVGYVMASIGLVTVLTIAGLGVAGYITVRSNTTTGQTRKARIAAEEATEKVQVMREKAEEYTTKIEDFLDQQENNFTIYDKSLSELREENAQLLEQSQKLEDASKIYQTQQEELLKRIAGIEEKYQTEKGELVNKMTTLEMQLHMATEFKSPTPY